MYHPTRHYCCPCNYRRIVAELPTFAYYETDNGVAVDLYAPQRPSSVGNDVKLTLRQGTDIPMRARCNCRWRPPATDPFPLQLRIPAWAAGTRVTVNDQGLNTARSSPAHSSPSLANGERETRSRWSFRWLGV